MGGVLVTGLPPGNKVGCSPFTLKTFSCHFFGHIESIVNLPGAEIHWQDSSKGDPQEGNTGDEDRFSLHNLSVHQQMNSKGKYGVFIHLSII